MPEAPLPARSIGWGIVGYGWVARDYAAPAILAAGHAVRAVCDPTPAARDAARTAHPAAALHEGLATMLAEPEVEAIYVATPNHLHRAAVEAIAAAGKAVLCEKPMAATLEDAEAMVAAVEGAGILYGTAFDQRHHPAHGAVRAALRGGLIGTPTAIRIAYACWLGADWTVTGEGDNWRADPARAGGGALMDLAPHGLDLAEYLLGEPIETIAALTQRRVQSYAVDDGALLIGRTSGGVLVQLHVAYNCPDALPRRRLEVLGSAGQILAENTMGQDAGGRVTHTDAAGRSAPLEVPEADASPFARQMAAFGRALSTGDRAEFSAARDLHTMRLLHRAYAEDPACR
ncbi:Gfo/Idh/MocA family oxidoreductase [Pararoseomonas sp. SCSIO 73927]|uniref:Gfo/Idh/MocA family protein n=1 Tax=Pararoseomonas sp. SCSIO 73927 TaxID=3114537 RepID=UPI0030CD9F04